MYGHMRIDLPSSPFAVFVNSFAFRLLPILFLSFILVSSSPACASTVEMTFTGVNGTAAFGYFVGPYYGALDDQPVNLFCVDFSNDVWIGETWEANLTSIGAGADLSQTRYGNMAGAISLYREAAWLTEQYATAPAAQYADIQATIWDLFNPRSAPQPASDFWLNEALANFTSADYRDFRIVTNLGPVEPTGQVQEFLTHVDTANTPEPAPFLLVAATLVGLATSGRNLRRLRRSR